MPVSPLDAAIALHQRNALEEAARVYHDILADDPRQADALHLLGVIAHQRGDSARAVRLIGRAIGLCPSAAAYHAHEETVADLEGVARRLLAWCGLEWEPACLAFHEGQRPIRTASITQVRQPLYRRSVGRWKHYEQTFGPLFARLSATPPLSPVLRGEGPGVRGRSANPSPPTPLPGVPGRGASQIDCETK